MNNYSKIGKEDSNYTKSEKVRTGKGHLNAPWFYDWFSGKEFSLMNIYNKIVKNASSYNKLNKE